MNRFLFGFACFCLVSHLDVGAIEVIKQGPIHEGFVTQEQGSIILESVPVAPPPRIMEQREGGNKNNTVWIPGYWSWSRKKGDFLWVSGAWRRPPSGHHWIPGYWKEYAEGWVWITGFWSAIAEDRLEYIDLFPPDNIDESIQKPPAEKNGFFWMSGYWEYSSLNDEYIWYSGRWAKLDPNQVYVPTRYIWREEGYVMVPGYWDWPIDERGTTYASVYIPREERATTVYHPVVVLEPIYIMELIFPYWPNYTYLFNYHFYFHFDLWVSWGAIPPWWNWSSWWGFPWRDQWWLWWWWSHPGFPNPNWLTAEDADQITPPPQFVLNMMKNIRPPANVNSNGVIGNFELYQAMTKISGRFTPILPSDPKQIEYIKQVANPKTGKNSVLVPRGTGKAIEPLQKPFFGPRKLDLKQPPQLVPIPTMSNTQFPSIRVRTDIGLYSNQASQEPQSAMPSSQPLDPARPWNTSPYSQTVGTDMHGSYLMNESSEVEIKIQPHTHTSGEPSSGISSSNSIPSDPSRFRNISPDSQMVDTTMQRRDAPTQIGENAQNGSPQEETQFQTTYLDLDPISPDDVSSNSQRAGTTMQRRDAPTQIRGNERISPQEQNSYQMNRSLQVGTNVQTSYNAQSDNTTQRGGNEHASSHGQNSYPMNGFSESHAQISGGPKSEEIHSNHSASWPNTPRSENTTMQRRDAPTQIRGNERISPQEQNSYQMNRSLQVGTNVQTSYNAQSDNTTQRGGNEHASSHGQNSYPMNGFSESYAQISGGPMSGEIHSNHSASWPNTPRSENTTMQRRDAPTQIRGNESISPQEQNSYQMNRSVETKAHSHAQTSSEPKSEEVHSNHSGHWSTTPNTEKWPRSEPSPKEREVPSKTKLKPYLPNYL